MLISTAARTRGATKCLAAAHRRCLVIRRVGERAPDSSVDSYEPLDIEDLSAFSDSLESLLDDDKIPQKRTFSYKELNTNQLPQSPLLDPAFLDSKNKNFRTKAPPSKAPTPFQQKLAKNPFALALATPVRMCQVTRLVLPQFFMQTFEVAAHPESNHAYYIPHGGFTNPMKPNKGSHVRPVKPRESSDIPKGAETTHPDEREGRQLGPGIHIVGRYAMLSSVATSERRQVSRLLSGRVRSRPQMEKIYSNAGFRSDMHDFVLELVQRRILESLKSLLNAKRGYLKGYDTWEEAQKYCPQIGVLLWTGAGLKKEGPISSAPEEFSTIALHSDPGTTPRLVAVHNLPLLLGEGKIEELQSKSSTKNESAQGRGSVFGKAIVGVTSKNPTVDLQLRLWWLQGYLAKHKKYLSVRE